MPTAKHMHTLTSGWYAMPTTIEATVNTAKTTEAAASEDASNICTLIEALVLKDTVDLKNKI